MRSYSLFNLAAAAVLLSAGAAAAADFSPQPPAQGRFYGSLHGGVDISSDPDASFVMGALTPTGTIDVDTGYRVGGSLGYDFTENYAAEIEATYVRSGVSSIDIVTPAPSSNPVSGHGSALQIMANAIVGEHYGAWRPYVGAGAGMARVSLNVDFATGLDDTDWAFAAQAFAGVDYELSSSTSLGGRYRYQHIGATDFTDNSGQPVSAGALGGHSFELVLKYRFGG